jgi:hypothetical protein
MNGPDGTRRSACHRSKPCEPGRLDPITANRSSAAITMPLSSNPDVSSVSCCGVPNGCPRPVRVARNSAVAVAAQIGIEVEGEPVRGEPRIALRARIRQLVHRIHRRECWRTRFPGRPAVDTRSVDLRVTGRESLVERDPAARRAEEDRHRESHEFDDRTVEGPRAKDLPASTPARDQNRSTTRLPSNETKT